MLWPEYASRSTHTATAAGTGLSGPVTLPLVALLKAPTVGLPNCTCQHNALLQGKGPSTPLPVLDSTPDHVQQAVTCRTHPLLTAYPHTPPATKHQDCVSRGTFGTLAKVVRCDHHPPPTPSQQPNNRTVLPLVDLVHRLEVQDVKGEPACVHRPARGSGGAPCS
jgi:hypothetical protein